MISSRPFVRCNKLPSVVRYKDRSAYIKRNHSKNAEGYLDVSDEVTVLRLRWRRPHACSHTIIAQREVDYDIAAAVFMTQSARYVSSKQL